MKMPMERIMYSKRHPMEIETSFHCCWFLDDSMSTMVMRTLSYRKATELWAMGKDAAVAVEIRVGVEDVALSF